MKNLKKIVLFSTFISLTVMMGCTKTLETSIIIDATRQDTWNTLIDFGQYPNWNPFVKKLEGKVTPGNKIQVQIQAQGWDPMEIEPTVIQYQEEQILQWEGKLLMPGIFTGKHSFILESISPTETRLIHKEYFSGVLVPFFPFTGTENGFIAMNNELKKRVENL